MGYDYHITRAGSQLRSAECPIPRTQWDTAFAQWHRAADIDAHFYWHEGSILIYTNPKNLGEIAAFAAESLGARLLGGDDEEYLPDGTIVRILPSLRPDLPARPL